MRHWMTCHVVETRLTREIRGKRLGSWHNVDAPDAAQAPQPYSHLTEVCLPSLLHRKSFPHLPTEKDFSPNAFHLIALLTSILFLSPEIRSPE